ncbi:DNA topoisomerase III [Halomonas elongata]|uniref:DNA topoisomerase n=1 Tax=Halomonas elongata (strain ATCC 33173 / DSM 2581 / NBRC 15536 / NCIMB 2198 / 1H9) TaxID=768066 RepID=E1VA36_HALED|nr:DNA topoisomerase III [Halomonas elongata]WBF17665.1 DNA topoisomerase III [Halomonas elongata]WPU46506.1 DNA topoisomerase III [Halomonas elongata DSM 2581]CBV43924.1 DNA topoisomerase 3 [Halomonas elongata DSM 2581]
MSRLFLCEKPTQARDIAKVLGASEKGNGCLKGRGITVTWGFGHLLEQANPEAYDPALKRWSMESLPILPTQWKLEVKPSAKKQFTVVKKLLSSASEVVIATDADREGEMIAREILEACQFSGGVSRLWLPALDEASIRKALGDIRPGESTRLLYHAALGRSRADWLVGMNLTRAFTMRAKQLGYDLLLSVGRVQTPVLKLVVDRDREIANFVPKPFWEVVAVFQAEGGTFQAKWQPADDDVLDESGRCINQSAAQAVVARCQGLPGQVTTLETTRKREAPPLAMDLGTLQQTCSKRWGYGAQQVLDIAQALYETHKATTYPRTDCRYLPLSQLDDAQQVVTALLTSDGELAPVVQSLDLTRKSRVWNDSKITAHHGIIPTTSPCDTSKMSEAEWNVYDLVRRHYLAQFLPPHEYDHTDVALEVAGERFATTGRQVQVEGWKVLFRNVQQDDAAGDEATAKTSSQALPPLQAHANVPQSSLDLVSKTTTPPKPFAEGTLIGAMKNAARFEPNPKLKARLKESAGIGTEATRAGIIETLLKRKFLTKKGRAIVATATGRQLIDALPEVVTNPGMTALWEQALDSVAAGELSLEDFMAKQQTLVERLIEQAKSATINLPQEPAKSKACPECGAPMKKRKNDYGSFWGCTKYPDCKGMVKIGSGKKRQGKGRKASNG